MLAFFENLLNIPSPTGSEEEAGEYVFAFLQQMGLKVEKQLVDGRRFNVIATTHEEPRVLLCTHLDTVLPDLPVAIKGDVIYGRGACDAKGALFSMVMAGERLLQKGIREFGFLFVVGEEKNSDGAKKAVNLSLGSEYVVIGEPTDNKLALGQKGSIVFQAVAHGRAGHSAYPQSGDSAIERLVRALYQWQNMDWGRHELLGSTTLNIGKISGGSGANVIAERAEAEGIFRVATSVQEVLEKLLTFCSEKFEIDVSSRSEPQILTPLEGLDTTVVSFGSDAPYLKPLGQVLMLGPGSVKYAHSDNEQIALEELYRASDLYVEIVEKLVS